MSGIADEEDSWFGDDPNTYGSEGLGNRVWCLDCGEWVDQAVKHDLDHRRVPEGAFRL